MTEIDDVLTLLETRLASVKPTVTEAGGLGADTAVRRYREGYITEAELAAELGQLGYPPSRAERYVAKAELDYQTDFLGDLITAYRTAFQRELIGEPELRSLLGELGIRPERIDALVQIELARFARRPAAAKPKPAPKAYETPAGRTRVQSLRMLFAEELISKEDLLAELRALEMQDDYAAAIAEQEQIKLEKAKAARPAAVVPPYKTEAGKVRVDTARLRFRRGMIDEAELYAQLLAAGVPDELADLIAEYEVARAQTRVAVPTG